MSYEHQRQHMVENQLRRRGICDARVLETMLAIPREEFIPERLSHCAYWDDPVEIGHGQTISQPYMTALMAQCLELSGTETVLEVGAGSGYHAAVLGALAARVVSLEIIPELADAARRSVERAGRGSNVLIVTGDGSLGYPESAPFDAISVAAAAPEIPPALLEQLRDPGRLVMPVGPAWDQELVVLSKRAGVIASRVVAYCRFVPLREGLRQELD